MKDIYDYLTEEDLTLDLRLFASVCGIETMRKILKNFSGISFYFPKVSRFESLVIKYIKENKNKPNSQIAKELRVSSQYIKILRNRFNLHPDNS